MMDNALEVEMVGSSGSSSIGDAVSGRGPHLPGGDGDDDDDLFYIPERRPSLDLGSNLMDTGQWPYAYAYANARALPRELSYGSMTSDTNSGIIDQEDDANTRVQLYRSDSFSSCCSFDSDSDDTMTKIKNKDNDDVAETTATPELVTEPTGPSHPSLTVGFTFKALCDMFGKLPSEDLKAVKTLLWKRYPRSFNTPPMHMDLVDLVDRLLECFGQELSLRITETVLTEIGQKKAVAYLQTLRVLNEVRHDLCETLRRTYGDVCEDPSKQEERGPFDNAFTDLHIKSTSNNGPNIEHEVMQIEKLDSNQDIGNLLSTKDILTSERVEQTCSKLAVLIGVAGSGKSMAVRKLIFDWMERRAHQDVSFLFPVPFRDLKQFEGSEVSLLQIVQTLYPETRKLRDEDYRGNHCKMMFVFDGLDEYTGELDFQKTKLVSDYADPAALNVIIVNLLRDRLYHRGLFLVTSRPQVNTYVPWDTIYDEIELQGFCDSEKDQYFQKRFKDPDQARRVIAHICSVRTLHIMCHLPLFCSLVANEYERIFREQGVQAELPRSLTCVYTKLLLTLTQQHRRFRAPDRSPAEQKDFLLKLGKLAFIMLERGEFKISRDDWKKVGISDTEAVINSGLCMQYITKLHVLEQEKVLSFIHPTVQEYLAALYAYLSFRDLEKNIFENQVKRKLKGMIKGHRAMELYKCALDRSLLCEDGKLDLFLRFLFGMAANSNLELLRPFCTSSVTWPSLAEEAAALLRRKIGGGLQSNRRSNLQLCLEELGVHTGAASRC